MKALRIPLPVLAAFILGLFLGNESAQDVPLQGPNTVGATPGTAVLPSSVRANPPQYADDPGIEQQFSIAPDRVFSYVGGAWGWCPRFALPTRPTNPTPTPTP